LPNLPILHHQAQHRILPKHLQVQLNLLIQDLAKTPEISSPSTPKTSSSERHVCSHCHHLLPNENRNAQPALDDNFSDPIPAPPSPLLAHLSASVGKNATKPGALLQEVSSRGPLSTSPLPPHAPSSPKPRKPGAPLEEVRSPPSTLSQPKWDENLSPPSSPSQGQSSNTFDEEDTSPNVPTRRSSRQMKPRAPLQEVSSSSSEAEEDPAQLETDEEDVHGVSAIQRPWKGWPCRPQSKLASRPRNPSATGLPGFSMPQGHQRSKWYRLCDSAGRGMP